MAAGINTKSSKKGFDNWDWFLQETLPRLKSHNKRTTSEARRNEQRVNKEKTKQERTESKRTKEEQKKNEQAKNRQRNCRRTVDKAVAKRR